MPSERVQREIDRLLDETEAALAESDWEAVRLKTREVLALDPDSEDATQFLAAAERLTPSARR